MRTFRRPLSMSSVPENFNPQSHERESYTDLIDAVYSPPPHHKILTSLASTTASRRSILDESVPISKEESATLLGDQALTPTATSDHTFGVPPEFLDTSSIQPNACRSSSVLDLDCDFLFAKRNSEEKTRRSYLHHPNLKAKRRLRASESRLDPVNLTLDTRVPFNVQLADVTINDIDENYVLQAYQNLAPTSPTTPTRLTSSLPSSFAASQTESQADSATSTSCDNPDSPEISDSTAPITALTPNCELANQPAQDNKNVLLKDLDLVDLRTCEACLLNADFRRIFRDWMQNELLLNYQGLINLDRWTDETKIDLMAKDIREHSSALLSLYYPEHQMFEGSSLPSSETGNHLQNLSRLSILESGMQSSRSSLLSSLHQKEFQNFLKTMLMTHLKKSGPHWIPKSGFYPCFCLVNPRVANCPIVLVSQNFSFSTGYQPYEMIGKTIHILRKSSTNTDNTQFFQEKGNPEIELSVCLRKDGGGFYGYWVIEPLLDPCGKVMFYLVLIQDITLDLKILLSPFLNISSQESSQFQFSPRMTDNQSKEDATISSGPSISNSRRSGTSSLKRDLKTLKTKYIREWVNTNSTSLNSRLGHNPKNRTQFLNRRNSTSLSFTSVFSTRNKVDICKIEKPLVPASQSMILTRRDRSIMYISKRTLEFLGIPTESTTDVWNPPILQEDITKFLYSNSAQETNDIISLITELFYRGTSGKCRCIIRYKSNLNESENDAKGKKSSAEVGKWVNIQFMPLQSKNGNSSLYVASLLEVKG